MIPSIDLLLTTLERALSVTILPTAANASAREEASLGILVARWLRDVIDDVANAERASERDCRAALADVGAILAAGLRRPASVSVLGEIREALARSSPERIAAAREETRALKRLLGEALGAARADGDDSTAAAIRGRLTALAGREIARERSFGRSTGMDPDAATVPTLAALSKTETPRDRP